MMYKHIPKTKINKLLEIIRINANCQSTVVLVATYLYLRYSGLQLTRNNCSDYNNTTKKLVNFKLRALCIDKRQW